MAINKANLKRAYLAHSTNIKVKNLRIGTLLAFALFIIFVIVDYFVYPQQISMLAAIRGVDSILLLLIFSLSYKLVFNDKTIKYASIFTVMLLNTSIASMIMVTEGATSPYYAGLNLVLLGASILFFFDLGETMISAAGTVLLYVVACIVHYYNQISPVDYPWLVFINNLSFLLGTGIICCFSSYYLSKNRFEMFRLNFELQEINRLKTEFFANVSHEIRTPLTLVLSPLEELLRGTNKLSDEVAGHVKMARDNSMRLLKLVNNFLDIMRLEEGKDLSKKAPQDLAIILGGLADSMVHLSNTKKVMIKKSIVDDPVVVNGDSSALEKIFINILNNAIKFTPKGGNVEVSLYCKDSFAVVEVKDTGIGMREEDIPHIFGRFNQIDSSATRRFQGSGIGLALVTDLLKSHQGTIDVESELGKGTLVRVKLPLIQDVSELSAGQTITHKDEDPMQALHYKAERIAGLTVEEPINNEYDLGLSKHLPRLLVVDDEPDMRRYIKEVLIRDYQVIQARDGKQALHLAQEYLPDLIVLDMMLPEMDGLEVCKLLKKAEQTKNIKIILLTARTDEAVKIEALENGANDFLTKPFSAIELKTRLRGLHTNLQLEQSLEKQNQELSSALVDLKEAEAQLLHSEKLSAIGSLASGLLHEVNNPLNYTITAAQILKRDSSIQADSDNAEIVSDIIEGMDRIKAIVSDLHTFAYPEEADKQHTFALQSAIDSALRFTSYERKDVAIKTNVDENLMVVGSNNHIVQVLVNLITNAVKAADKSKPEIIINAKINNNRAWVNVRDNGKGMDAETLSHIFEPFYTTREVGEGLGMGLSICHTIIQNHQGTLTAESELGEWTEFTFDLSVPTNSA